MVFVAAKNKPAIFLMLSEADVTGMRQGSTRFVDKRQVGDLSLNEVIVSLHKNDTESLELIRSTGQHVPQLVFPDAGPEESVCKGCNGLIRTVTMFEGMCIVCWATLAKKIQTGSN